MKVFLTGGTGYLGSNLAKTFLNADHEVAILKRPESDLEYFDDQHENLQFFDYDGTYESVRAAVEQAKPELGIHFAAYYTFTHTEDQLDTLLDSNIRLGLYFTEALVQNGCSKLINTSTSFIHYKNDDYNPVNLYAATKQAFTDLLKFYTKSGKLSAITLKLFDTYGPGDERGKLINRLIAASGTDEVIKLTEGNQVMDLVHIQDVMNAYIKAIELILKLNKGYYSEFGGVSGERITLKNLVKLIEEISGKSINTEFGALPYREREVMEPWSTFWELPDLPPKVSLKVGLEDMIKSTR